MGTISCTAGLTGFEKGHVFELDLEDKPKCPASWDKGWMLDPGASDRGVVKLGKEDIRFVIEVTVTGTTWQARGTMTRPGEGPEPDETCFTLTVDEGTHVVGTWIADGGSAMFGS